MDTISSSKFRKIYAKLTEQTIVTANGHSIGLWLPASPQMESVARVFEVPDHMKRKINKG